jgi:hypothetical protein
MAIRVLQEPFPLTGLPRSPQKFAGGFAPGTPFMPCVFTGVPGFAPCCGQGNWLCVCQKAPQGPPAAISAQIEAILA